eukprot:TRINITY_DN14719_c0_g1_i1.p1 TRINITY_DN14719_c0_g1~~TRINITY_DN14719_c0_g1_i1.p1  ORF type:complete len:265 (-),score=29.70 TRINITY_DN14719_c0_g1_i1:95-889(-)
MCIRDRIRTTSSNILRFHKSISDSLTLIEKSFTYPNHKFGVLYSRAYQTENQVYSNNDNLSENYTRFLEFLGEKIVLRNWKEFSGGLDVKSQESSTGKFSIFTRFKTHDIMFHVSTLLPFSPLDPQQVARKRHIGNDILVIVFHETTSQKQGEKDTYVQFNPEMMCSQFNHVYAVVHCDEHQNIRLEITAREGVVPFGPRLLVDPETQTSHPFKLDDTFREFFFTKVLNAERAALHAPAFANKNYRVRKQLLNTILSDCNVATD